MIYIDAHNYLKRIYHGGGSPYGLFYSLMLKHENESVTVVCDGSKSREFRKALHPGYKKGRDAGDDPVYWEVYNNCIKLTSEFKNNFTVMMGQGEADDYIVNNAKAGDTVISNDKDLWPLIEKGVKVLLNASTAVDLDLVQIKFDTREPHLIYLYKALVGDTSDKIPGKRGFGVKSWPKLENKEEEYQKMLNGDFGDWPDSVKMSWTLGRPYQECTGDIIVSLQNGNPMKFITDRGIML